MQSGGIRGFYEQFGGIYEKYSQFFGNACKREIGRNGEVPRRSKQEVQREVKQIIVNLTLFFNKNGLPYDTEKVRKMDYEEALMFFENLLSIKDNEKKELEKINARSNR